MPRLSPAQRAARRAGLRHSSDAEPGLRRIASGDGFRYVDADGAAVTDEDTLARIGALAVPPAYTDVWICADARGHVQATGRDARGRKQYRYHAAWAEARRETTFGALADFGRALPPLRRRVAADLGRRGLPRERVLSLVVALLDASHQRIGSREYARANGTYGLSTLRDRHARVDGTTLRLRFRGKHSLWREVTLRDRRLAALVQRCRDLPGQALFQYDDGDGAARAITSTDVNAYLATCCGAPVTAKHFRTWGGSLAFARALAASGADETAPAKRASAALDAAAAYLGNTAAVCRGHYVHPDLHAAALDGTFDARWKKARRGRPPRGLDADEAALVRFVEAG